MGKFDGVLLVSDFDDTLYGSDCTISQENIEKINYFIREGGRFTVATGRAHTTMAPMVPLVPINAPVVLSNGAVLYDFANDCMLRQTSIDPQVGEDMVEVVRAFPEIAFEAYHGEDIYAFQPNEVTWRHLQRAKCDCIVRPLEDIPLPWVKAILQEENDLLQTVQTFMVERWADRYEVIFSNAVMLEVTAKGSTKGGMVLHLADQLGIDKNHIYCVGDNQNDLPMLAISAIPFAPSNCAQAVRDWGAKVINSCDDSCISQIVDTLDQIYQ